MTPDEFIAWVKKGSAADLDFLALRHKGTGADGRFYRADLIFPFAENQQHAYKQRSKVIMELFEKWDIIGPNKEYKL